MLPWSAPLAGRLDELVIESVLLRDNPLGDPSRRPLLVYVPPGYDDSRQRYPSIYVLQGYTGHLAMWRNRSPFRQPFPETADAVFAGGDAPPAVVVFVDAWTAYGGSQFVDSPGTGRYHSYLCEEVVPYVDSRYRTLPEREYRAISGKSSGGFGAMITPMLRPDVFGALASHAGDTLYELSYVPQFGKAVRHLRDYDGNIDAWWSDFRSRTAFTKPADGDLLETLAVSACFSAREDSSPRTAVRPTYRGAARRGLAAVAGLGSGTDGTALRRGVALAARGMARRWYPRRMVPRSGCAGIPRPAARRGAT